MGQVNDPESSALRDQTPKFKNAGSGVPWRKFWIGYHARSTTAILSGFWGFQVGGKSPLARRPQKFYSLFHSTGVEWACAGCEDRGGRDGWRARALTRSSGGAGCTPAAAPWAPPVADRRSGQGGRAGRAQAGPAVGESETRVVRPAERYLAHSLSFSLPLVLCLLLLQRLLSLSLSWMCAHTHTHA